MEFRILGPLEVRSGRETIPLRTPKVRVVLAALLARPNRVASSRWLIEQVWGQEPPTSALATLQLYVSKLRRLLPPGVLITRPPGYQLTVGDDELDLTRFERLTAAGLAAKADGDHQRAATMLRDALALWRGAALADVDSETLQRVFVPRLEEQRLSCVEDRIEAELRVGLDPPVGELHELVAVHPLRERLAGHLMLALYRQGQQSEALAIYGRTRRRLHDELGIDPSPALQRLQQAILGSDPTLDAAADRPPALAPTPSMRGARASIIAPAQLPPAIEDLVGRETALKELADIVASSLGTAVAIGCVFGKPGVGKTALAVRAAHRLRPSFPDGQLFIDLHGTKPHPVDATDALAQFLRALGLDGRAIPDDARERERLYRSVLADRRVLIVLDDARDAAHVRPLLPGGGHCAVMVTSRGKLAALEGGQAIALDVLEPVPAAELLTRIVGPERADDEQAAVADIVRLCGWLPLAVRIAGARLAAKPHWRLAEFTRRLADGRRRLDELAVGDLEVRASVALSYDNLLPDERRTYRRLGLLDQPTFDDWVVAALLDRDRAEVSDVLERLVDAQLLEVAERDTWTCGGHYGRYRLHDLLRVFARERLEGEVPAPLRKAALGRVLAAWVAAAEAGDAAMVGGMGSGDAAAVAVRDDAEVVAGFDAAAVVGPDARAWFAVEQANLVAVVEQAHGAGLWEPTWRLARALTAFLAERSQWTAWQRTHELARDAAHRAGNLVVETSLLQRLGDLYRDQGRFDEAAEHFQRCLDLAGQLADRVIEAYALRGLGDVHWGQGRPAEALAAYQRALPLFEATGERRGEAYTLRGMAVVYRGLFRTKEAFDAAERSLRAFRAMADRIGEAYALRSQGCTFMDLGTFDRAVACLEAALAIFRELGDRLGEAASLLSLGQCLVYQRRYAEAITEYESCRVAFEDVGDTLAAAYAQRGLGDALTGLDRLGEAHEQLRLSLIVVRAFGDLRWQGYTLFSLGWLYLRQRQVDDAIASFDECLCLFRRIDARLWVARAQQRLGEARRSTGDATGSHRLWHSAYRRFRELGSPEATEVARLLVDAGCRSGSVPRT